MSYDEEKFMISVKGMVHCWKLLDKSEEEILADVDRLISSAFRVGYNVARNKTTPHEDLITIQELQRIGFIELYNIRSDR